MKNLKLLLVVGAFALVPSLGHGFVGNLVNCDPPDGVQTFVSLSGMTCDETLQKIKIQATFANGCTANGAAPWTAWATNKWGSKISAADAATINGVTLKIKGSTLSSCNFTSTPTSAPANVSGSLSFTNTVPEKVKGGKGSFVAGVGADLGTQSAVLNGVMTKGFGLGAQIRIQIGIDTGAPENANILACNVGAICPPDIFADPTNADPIETLVLLTTPTSHMRIGIVDNASCLGLNDPFDCCTGAATGSCDD